MKRLILLISFALISCSNPDVPEDRPEYNRHKELINQFSGGDEINSGFYNHFAFKATLLNTPTYESIIGQKASFYKWSTPKLLSEREKVEQNSSSETKVFMSFFTPNRKDDNFTDKNSIWKVYLESNGQRYEGKVVKDRRRPTELQKLYPYHSKWNSAYMIKFNVPTSRIENKPSKFTVTGPMGSKEVTFNQR